MLDEQQLIHAIARREGTAKELAIRFDMPPSALRAFVDAHREQIEAVAQPESDPAELTPQDLGELWISNKSERLRRLQRIADLAYDDLITNNKGMVPAELATAMREFRSYLMLAANELGQLLNRGAGESGEGTYLSVEMNGVNMDDLK